ncbi:MAG TPA: DUF3800 domain-containing protein [Actinomycetota bacterium]|nr:DUF3800 domain-containing protein [Actinomycetota bacterium]
MPPLYTFIDEGGNFDFSPGGTRYFTLTCVTMARPFPLEAALSELRFDLLEQGIELERFHASTDKQSTRDSVFALISQHIEAFRADSVIVEKCKTGPALRPPDKIYPRMLGYLLQYLVNGTDWTKWSELIVIADRLEEKRKRRALEKAAKETLSKVLAGRVPYRVLHHESHSCYGLQIADYFNWAIYKAWTENERRPLGVVGQAVKSQFDIFRFGTTRWY